MPRCLICGRRWAGETPRCPHEQNAGSLSLAEPSTNDLPALDVTRPTSIAGYRVQHLLGAGGFGTVVAATRERDGLVVAIKTVHRDDPHSYRRLLREAEALRAIGAPFVPEVYDVGSLSDGSPYLVMEKLTLPSLDTKMGEPMSRELFGGLARGILAAVEAAHERGYVHRDLKPENIFVDEELLVARLIDFGLARGVHRDPDSGEDSAAGMMLGTPIYMAPEQCEGLASIDIRADIYALGVVLYEMLTARPPFFGKRAEVCASHVSHRPPPPSHVAPVPSVFDQVILRCLAKEPERRFAGAAALRRALAQAMEQESHPVRSPVLATRRPAESHQPVLVGLVFFHSAVGTSTVIEQLGSLGGQLAYVDGQRCMAAFGLTSGSNPVERAHEGAHALIEQGIATRVLVERDRVRAHLSPDGIRRALTSAFRNPELFPRGSDPPGVLLTSRAAEGLSRVETVPVPGREGIFRGLGLPDDQGEVESGPPVGRAGELSALQASAETALAERQPTIVTVISEVGYGKSQLAAWLAATIRRTMPGVQVIDIRARELLGVEHDQLLQSLLTAALELPAQPPADHGRSFVSESLGAAIAEEVWPAVALVLGWLAADAPEVRRLSAAPSALRSAAAEAVGESLRRLARSRPVCIVLDDAHFADETTLDALEYAALAEAAVPLWVCALAEPIFGRARPAWASRAARAQQIKLTGLAPEQAAELCRRLLHPADNVPEQTIVRMVEWTRGSPLLLTELVTSAKRQGLIRRHARGDGWYLATDELERLPELPQVEWLAERELCALSAPLSASARLVALLGAEFTVLEVEGVLRVLEDEGLGEMFPLDAWVGISGLLGQGVLSSQHDGYFEFRHVYIREQVVRSMAADLRVHIHKAAFRYYRDAPPAMKSRYRAQRLAWHAEHSGLLGAAAATYLHLAERAQSRHEYLEAELMYGRTLELMPKDKSPTRMKALNGRGLMHYRLSRFADAFDDLAAAMAIADHLDDTESRLELLLDQATVLDWSQDFQRSRALVEEARALAPRIESPLIVARLDLGLGRAHFRSRELDRAEPLLERAVERAEPLGDHGYETLVISLMMLGIIISYAGRVEEATSIFDRAVELCEERGDKLHLAAALNNRRDLWISQKNVKLAARDGLRAQRIGREIGQALIEFATAYNLAELYYYASDLDAAWPHVARAVDIEPRVSKRPDALLLYARLLGYAGRHDEARQVVERIRARQTEARLALDDDALMGDAEDALCTMVELGARQASAAEWHHARTRAAAVLPPVELAEFLEFMAMSARARGNDDEAAQLLGEALEAAEKASHLVEERVRAARAA